MQYVIIVVCNSGPSLRDKIAKDIKIDEFKLKVSEQKRQGRRGGWTKIHSTEGAYGAINIQWDQSAYILSCRVISRKPGKPDEIVGVFINYLLTQYRKQIYAINIYPE